jgi:hypothetical protein
MDPFNDVLKMANKGMTLDVSNRILPFYGQGSDKNYLSVVNKMHLNITSIVLELG